MPDNKPIIIVLGIVVLAIVGLVAFFMMSSDEAEPLAQREIAIPSPPPEPVPEPDPVVVVEEEPEPLAEQEPPRFTLPLLDDSDQLIRDGVVSLTRHEGINAWLAPNELIRKFVAVIDNVGHGQVAKEMARFLAPEGPFLVFRIDDETYTLDPASYRRYDLFTEIVLSLDARRAAEFYQLLSPLFQKAYGELGYRNVDFDDVMFNAMGRLLETPVIEGPVRLKRPLVMFKYEDSKLENLSSVQKQMIRMGPRNMRMLHSKIGQVATELRSVLGR